MWNLFNRWHKGEWGHFVRFLNIGAAPSSGGHLLNHSKTINLMKLLLVKYHVLCVVNCIDHLNLYYGEDSINKTCANWIQWRYCNNALQCVNPSCLEPLLFPISFFSKMTCHKQQTSSPCYLLTIGAKFGNRGVSWHNVHNLIDIVMISCSDFFHWPSVTGLPLATTHKTIDLY